MAGPLEVAKLFGARLRTWRVANGLVLDEAVERLGMTNSLPKSAAKSRLREIEDGTRVPTLEFVCLVAETVGVDVWELLKPTGLDLGRGRLPVFLQMAEAAEYLQTKAYQLYALEGKLGDNILPGEGVGVRTGGIRRAGGW